MKIEEWIKLEAGTTIEFKGALFFLMDTTKYILSTPLCTKEQYDNGEISYAHIYWGEHRHNIHGEEGTIWRHHEVIGSIKDINVSNKNVKYYKE